MQGERQLDIVYILSTFFLTIVVLGAIFDIVAALLFLLGAFMLLTYAFMLLTEALLILA